MRLPIPRINYPLWQAGVGNYLLEQYVQLAIIGLVEFLQPPAGGLGYLIFVVSTLIEFVINLP
jgi:hypothetical protein